MGTFLNNDNAIWIKNVNADPDTLALLRQLKSGTRLKLEIEGRRGDWERMADGKDGRPTFGLKPVGSTIDFWKTMAKRRGEHLEFKVVDPRNSYLSDVQTSLSEWQSPEDEQAFRDL